MEKESKNIPEREKRERSDEGLDVSISLNSSPGTKRVKVQDDQMEVGSVESVQSISQSLEENVNLNSHPVFAEVPKVISNVPVQNSVADVATQLVSTVSQSSVEKVEQDIKVAVVETKETLGLSAFAQPASTPKPVISPVVSVFAQPSSTVKPVLTPVVSAFAQPVSTSKPVVSAVIKPVETPKPAVPVQDIELQKPVVSAFATPVAKVVAPVIITPVAQPISTPVPVKVQRTPVTQLPIEPITIQRVPITPVKQDAAIQPPKKEATHSTATIPKPMETPTKAIPITAPPKTPEQQALEEARNQKTLLLKAKIAAEKTKTTPQSSPGGVSVPKTKLIRTPSARGRGQIRVRGRGRGQGNSDPPAST
jgi:hypothetical protein